MSLGSRARATITVGLRTEGAANEYGDPVVSYSTTTFDIPAWVVQVSEAEDNLDRELKSRQWNILGDAGRWSSTGADATAQVTLEGGEVTRILGEPALYSGHRGAHHYEMTVEEVL